MSQRQPEIGDREQWGCGCIYVFTSARNTASLGGSWYTTKWQCTMPCAAHARPV